MAHRGLQRGKSDGWMSLASSDYLVMGYCGMGRQFLSKSVESGAAVNYLFNYCLYCATTVVLLMCIELFGFLLHAIG